MSVNFKTPIDRIANHFAQLIDDRGYVVLGEFNTASTPATPTNVFQKGCMMIKTDAVNGVGAWYENTGTLAAPVWSLVPATGSGITELTGDVTAGPGSGSQAASVESIQGVVPSHVIVYAGNETTVGGSATETFTVTGALTTDLAFVMISDSTGLPTPACTAIVSAPDTLSVTFAADPGNTVVFSYQIIRETGL